ncbi:MAG: TadE family type IV pilus minor pilin [Actinomycetales bacterium]|nr:TadE family type IV pilus minor pilin [Leifsonia sp.]
MTAEFAVTLPAVVLCLALCVGAVQLIAQQVRLADAAAVAARLLGRGDDPGAVVTRSGASGYETSAEDGLLCVRLSARSPLGAAGMIGIDASAQACSVDQRDLEEG